MPQKLYTEEEFNSKLDEFWNRLEKMGVPQSILDIRKGLVPAECCPICMEDFNITEMVKCPVNSHFMGCKTCMENFKETHDYSSYGDYNKIKCPCCRTKLYEQKTYYTKPYKFEVDNEYKVQIYEETQDCKGGRWTGTNYVNTTVYLDKKYKDKGKDKIRLELGIEFLNFAGYHPQYLIKRVESYTGDTQGTSKPNIKTFYCFNADKTKRYRCELDLIQLTCNRPTIKKDILLI